ncbi:serine hydrolase domain-containing protein [Micromonospora sp. NPDC050397]|uniref:serine hydrolase domain-containing protein n=1 Tax=Micromonospora sp. NPDC050397 TaxID=3364279 RepID=UPI00384A8189
MTRELTQAGVDRLHDAMADRVDRGELPGLVTLLAKGDDVRVDPIGFTDFDRTEPMRRDTIFRIASMTKPVLAVATMMLVEDGRLSLAEPVDRLLPELADRQVLKSIDGPLDETVPADRQIVVEDLLTFRMGSGVILEPTFDPPFPIVHAAQERQLVLGAPDPRTPHDPDEWIKQFGALPLICQPGERWQYNVGTLVLGVLVARAAGQPLGDFFRARIFDPLGMTETGFWLPAEYTRRLPSYYMTDFASGKLESRTVSTPSEWASPPVFPSGSAGLLSTADDYLAFARLLLDKGVHRGERLLSAESVELMTRNHLTGEQITGGGVLLSGKGWGLGMAVAVEPDAVSPVPGRYGWDGGYGTTWFNDPNQGLIAIGLSQTSDFMWNGGMDEFARLAVGASEE